MSAEPLDSWETVADGTRLSMATAHLPDGMAGAADGPGRISAHCHRAARVLTHELALVEADCHGHQTEAVEV